MDVNLQGSIYISVFFVPCKNTSILFFSDHSFLNSKKLQGRRGTSLLLNRPNTRTQHSGLFLPA